MSLVVYSESEESDSSSAPVSTISNEKHPTKSSFRKFVSSDGHKIKVGFAPPHQSNGLDEYATEELSLPKRRRLDESSSSKDFNALLPPPKNAKATAALPTKRDAKAQKGSTFTFKTASEPAFTRNSLSLTADSTEQNNTFNSPDTFIINDSVTDRTGIAVVADTADTIKNSLQNTNLSTKSTVFKPLSVVSKKSGKGKAANLPVKRPENRLHSELLSKTSQKPTNKTPKTSLFSIGDTDIDISHDYAGVGHTEASLSEQPGQRKKFDDETSTHLYSNAHLASNGQIENYPAQVNAPKDSLLAIAEDLNLPQSARRQLFGRNHGKSHCSSEISVNVVNFNTDNEYAANEELRAAGETIQHNPVRSIAPGKHSLRQLVSSATTQKDALEEHFASGRRNRKEAGGKYGW